MIRNLNQVTFQGFGTVPPERSQNAKGFDRSAAVSVALSQSEAEIWQAVSDTWVANGNGSSVLSVSMDGETYQDFYLDKPVCIKPRTFFSISPFTGPADALLYSAQPPETRGSRSTDSQRVDHQLQVEGIYTFFYQEKEQGFLFPGESHPMAELTYVDQGTIHSVADGQDLLLKQGELVIYGPGDYVEELKAICAEDPRVEYGGMLLSSQVMEKEMEATLLVNPRPTGEEYVKYSFPSKTMEYMASGTPVLTTRLPGMPAEYFPYVHFIDEETPEGIARALKRVLSRSDSELFSQGMAARAFILKTRNNLVQAEKILDMLEKTKRS